VPARAASLAGLPPTYIATGALDLFVEEDIEFARRLMRDGVPTELHVWPGVCHAFDFLAPQFELSQAYERTFHLALKRGLGVVEAAAPPAADAAVMEQLKAIAPGIPAHDLPRFARSLAGPEPYVLGSDSRPKEDVPRGALHARRHTGRTVYPGVERGYSVYVPHGHDTSHPAALMVFQDGARYLGPECNAAVVFDNLIASGAIPPTVGVFVEPGEQGPGLPIYGGAGNRSVEYDSLGDAYVRFLIDELLPEATEGLTIDADPASHAICGLSSGGICALNAAWERSDFFGKVVSHCGSFVDIRGGDALASKIRRCGPKALRVFLQTGARDLDLVFGHWVHANRTLAAALDYHGIDHQLVVGDGGHSLAHGGAIFPDTLRWLWRRSPT
jgi:enterochelin esterase family protein